MADIHDYLQAAREVDDALASLDALGGRIEDRGGDDVALALCVVGRALVLAVREVGVRADYVARDRKG